MSPQSFTRTRYSAKVWAGAASLAVFAVSSGASLWLMFGQDNPLGLKHAQGQVAFYSSFRP